MTKQIEVSKKNLEMLKRTAERYRITQKEALEALVETSCDRYRVAYEMRQTEPAGAETVAA